MRKTAHLTDVVAACWLLLAPWCAPKVHAQSASFLETVDFEKLSGPNQLTGYPLAPFALSQATFSGGEITTKTLVDRCSPACQLPDQTTVYGGTAMHVSFNQPASNVTFKMYIVSPTTYGGCEVTDDTGGQQTWRTSNNALFFTFDVSITSSKVHSIDVACQTVNAPQSPVFIDDLQFTVNADLSDPVDSNLVTLDQNASVAINSDTNLLASASRQVSGATADGVTQLLVRIPSVNVGDTFNLQLSDENGSSGSTGANGGLYAVDKPVSTASSTLVVAAKTTKSGPMAFAAYIAPVNFVRGNQDEQVLSRSLKITIDSQGTSTPTAHVDLPLTLVRPPVFLVHGLWGEAADWDTFTDITGSSRIIAFAADYSDSNSQGLAVNAPKVFTQLKNYIHDYAVGLNVAAVQADVIGHSMGGLVSRYLPVSPSFEKRLADYYQGPVHKLITIGTPHFGTPLSAELRKPQNFYSQLILDFKHFYIFQGAVEDLEGTGDGMSYSPAIINIMASHRPFPIAYVGGTSDVSNWPDATAGIPLALNTACLALTDVALHLTTCPDTIISSLSKTGWPALFANAPNDSLVPIISQFSGTSSVTSVPHMLHDGGITGLGFNPPIELGSPNAIGALTLNLLNARTDDAAFTPAGKN